MEKTHILTEHKGRYRVHEFLIVDAKVQNLLRKKSCSELKLVKQADAIEKCITDDYTEGFHRLGCVEGITHHIKLDEHVKPVVHLPHRSSNAEIMSKEQIRSDGKTQCGRESTRAFRLGQ